jgi:hypothetical protein
MNFYGFTQLECKGESFVIQMVWRIRNHKLNQTNLKLVIDLLGLTPADMKSPPSDVTCCPQSTNITFPVLIVPSQMTDWDDCHQPWRNRWCECKLSGTRIPSVDRYVTSTTSVCVDMSDATKISDASHSTSLQSDTKSKVWQRSSMTNL